MPSTSFPGDSSQRRTRHEFYGIGEALHVTLTLTLTLTLTVTLTLKVGVDIAAFSAMPNEAELLILPGTRLVTQPAAEPPPPPSPEAGLWQFQVQVLQPSSVSASPSTIQPSPVSPSPSTIQPSPASPSPSTIQPSAASPSPSTVPLIDFVHPGFGAGRLSVNKGTSFIASEGSSL